MKILRLAAIAALVICGPASAQEIEKQVELKVVVASDGENDGTEIHWVGDGTDIEGLAVGESRTIIDESGREVTVTRTEDGMQFEVDGETVAIPEVGAHGGRIAFVDAAGGNHDVEFVGTAGEEIDVEVSGDTHFVRAHHPDGITIISDEPLDESVRESIRSVLISAGKDGDVTFIDGSAEGKHVKVIRKRVELSR